MPEGYQVEMVAGPDLVDYPMFATLDETGRLFVFESIGNVYETSEQAIENPQFRIKLLEDLDQDGKYDKSTIFADHLSFPQGGVFIDGSLIASSAPDLLKLTDTDGDGVADQREVLLSGWTLNVNANSLIGPFLGPDGWLYLTSAIEGFDVSTREGQQLKGETARIWRVRPDGSELQWVSAGGMNNPVELTFTDAGEIIGTQTFFVDPQRGVRDAITYWTEGGIYGKKNSNIDRDQLPRTGDLLPVVSQYSRVAPVGIASYRSGIMHPGFAQNLFSTQFNTHQVIRHELTRHGASFKLEDQLFLWSGNEDFHPTDVLEDADGSLLVVETGGWFILGCPLSQVSKPQLKGAVYRITRQGMDKISDPYGNGINWESLPVAELSTYLEDRRPFVSDRALKELINRGNNAVETFAGILSQSESVAARIKAVYGCYQINTGESQQVLKTGLSDQDLNVRVAAARAAGMTGSPVFTEDLTRMLSEAELSAVRQAAVALGQIGSAEAIKVILAAVDSTNDRFVDHALKYALISIDRPVELYQAMAGATEPQIHTILVALDQMSSGALTAQTVIPYLEHPGLKPTALWVASHHPQWAPDLITYLRNSLSSGDYSEEILADYQNLIENYCGTPEMQSFLEELIREGNKITKQLALNSMGRCQLDPFPESWQQQIAGLLSNSTDAGILMQAVELIKLRGLSGFSNQLDQVIQNTNYPISLRVATVSAALSENKRLKEPQFLLLCSQFTTDNSPIVTHNAAQALTSADLSDEQLQYLAEEVLPAVHPFVLPRLLPAFEESDDIDIGTKLAGHLHQLPSLDNYTEEYLSELFSHYPPEIKDPLNDLLLKLRAVRTERINRISMLGKGIGEGSEEKGRAFYFGKATCSTCHTMPEGGGTLGPDLTSIQKDRSVHDIIEAIVYPSVSFVREYETYQITTKSGELRGIIKEQTPDMMLLETAPGTTIRVPMDDITAVEQLEVSMMPQGLDQILSEQEFSDLMAYLLGKDLEY